MSSTQDSLKQPADSAAAEEPGIKKVKLADTEPKAADNGTTATDKAGAEQKNGGADNKNRPTPSKAVNGNDRDAAEGADILDGDDGENGEADGVFDPRVAKCLEQVESIQSEICNLNEKASEEILKVEQKFNKLRRPFFERRNEVLMEIPNFWVTSLANHPVIAPMIESAQDEDCLHYMVNLDVEEFEDIKSGYKLKLHFDENPYLQNKVLVKEFQIVSSEEVVSTSSPIEYKDTPQGKELKQVVERSIAQFRRDRTQQSFFAWFVEPSESGDEVAEILKDQIWPNPLELFYATPEEDYAGTDDDESDDDDEEIDDEDIDDEEEGLITEGVDYSEEEIEGEEVDDEDEDIE